MKLIPTFIVFLLADDKTRLAKWRVLRKLCMQRCGIATTRKRKATGAASDSA